MSNVSIATTVSSVASAVASIASAVAAVASTTTSTNTNKEENTMSNSVVASTTTASIASTTTTSTDPAIDQLRKNIDAADKNLIVIYQLRKLEVLSNDLIDIAEKYRNETDSELLKEGLSISVCLTKDYIDTFYKLPEEYRDKANKKTEEWWMAALDGNFEDIVSSSVKFSRGLYRELLNELMDKQYQLLSC